MGARNIERLHRRAYSVVEGIDVCMVDGVNVGEAECVFVVRGREAGREAGREGES
jgi:hypothetical protein